MLQLAGELVRLNVDAILAISLAGVTAAARATKTIPIVAVDLETDPIAAGFVATLARPGGNVTGLFLDIPELSGKWIELLKAAVPKLTRVSVLWDPATSPNLLKAAETTAPIQGVQVRPREAHGPDELAQAFGAAAAWPAGAMLVLPSPVFNSARKQIAELARKHRMPALMPFTGFAEDGGLMAYGPHLGSMFRQAADVMASLLRGGRPAHTPIERPSRFELTVNLRTAKALGLTIPPSLLLRADQTIE
jgi:putative ABC transport system substrate-binding protein